MDREPFQKIIVAGLWHLGCVTAACLADKGYNVVAFDPSDEVIQQANKGMLPIYEPGLDVLVKKGVEQKHLRFSNAMTDFDDADLIWITFDTPVNDKDEADVKSVTDFIKTTFKHLKNNAIVIVSSQLPVGSVHSIRNDFKQQYPSKQVFFTSSPENLRLGKAIQIFQTPDRIVMGVDDDEIKLKLTSLLNQYSENIVWMSVLSAEMTKHAINAFLAVSVTFINELASICESVGANAAEVERGLKTEERIGPKAYLKPGCAFAGGTLARDIDYLIKISDKNDFPAHLMHAIQASNQNHKAWLQRTIKEELQHLSGKKVGVMGLTYKPGTNTLRRSSAIETCRWLSGEGVEVLAFDPAIKAMPEELDFNLHLKQSLSKPLEHVDALAITIKWHELRVFKIFESNRLLVFDIKNFLTSKFLKNSKIKYMTFGRAA